MPKNTLAALFVSLILKSLCVGQTYDPVETNRLIGTRSDIWFDSVWAPLDSTSLHYSGLNHYYRSEAIDFWRIGLTGKIPALNPTLRIGQPYLYNLASLAWPFTGDSVMFDTMHTYLYDDEASNWIEATTARHYQQNRLQDELTTQLNDPPLYPNTLTEVYYLHDAAQHVSEIYKIFNGDSSFHYYLHYDGDQLTAVDDFLYDDGIRYPYWSRQYQYDANGRIIENAYTDYSPIAPYPADDRIKDTYVYTADGKLARIEGWTMIDTTYYQTQETIFTYQDQNHLSVEIRDRNYDLFPLTFYAWETEWYTDYYHTDNRLDSVISMVKMVGVDLLNYHFTERFVWSGDLLVQRILEYNPALSSYNETHDLVYDDKDRKIKHITYYNYIPDDLVQRIDSTFHYDNNSNVYLIEKGVTYLTEDPNSDVYSSRYNKYFYYDPIELAGQYTSDLYIQAYPSPAADQFTIHIGLPPGLTAEIDVDIYTPEGQTVYHNSVNAENNSQLTIDGTRWSSGVYIIHASSKSGEAWQKMVMR